MKMPESFFAKTALSLMPLMAYPFGWQAPALVTGLYGLSLVVFWPVRRFFPERTAKAAFFLWLGLWGQLSWTLLGLSPLWIVSVFILVPSGFLDSNAATDRSLAASRTYFMERILNGLGFFMFAWIFASTENFALRLAHAAPGAKPVFVFFLLFAAAFLWKNQPAQARGEKK